MKHISIFSIFLFLISFLSACNEEQCNKDKAHNRWCEDNKIKVCYPPDADYYDEYHVIEIADCTEHDAKCTIGKSGGAACQLSEQLCPQDIDWDYLSPCIGFCLNGRVARCDLGIEYPALRSEDDDCLLQGKYCVESLTEGQASCSFLEESCTEDQESFCYNHDAPGPENAMLVSCECNAWHMTLGGLCTESDGCLDGQCIKIPNEDCDWPEHEIFCSPLIPETDYLKCFNKVWVKEACPDGAVCQESDSFLGYVCS